MHIGQKRALALIAALVVTLQFAAPSAAHAGPADGPSCYDQYVKYVGDLKVRVDAARARLEEAKRRNRNPALQTNSGALLMLGECFMRGAVLLTGKETTQAGLCALSAEEKAAFDALWSVESEYLVSNENLKQIRPVFDEVRMLGTGAQEVQSMLPNLRKRTGIAGLNSRQLAAVIIEVDTSRKLCEGNSESGLGRAHPTRPPGIWDLQAFLSEKIRNNRETLALSNSRSVATDTRREPNRSPGFSSGGATAAAPAAAAPSTSRKSGSGS